MKHYYVYRISNKIINKHYYGVRSSIKEPKLDLGFKYFSSSSDKEFMQDQKDNPSDYKYKVIKTFNSYVEASEYEIMLLRKFKVTKNESFYNKAIYSNCFLNCDNRGTIVVLDKRSETYKRVTTEEFYKNRQDYFCVLDDSRKAALDIEKNVYVYVSPEEFQENDNLRGVNFGKVSGSDNPGAKTLLVYDNFDNLKFTLFGNSKEMTALHNLPYHNLKWSARMCGEPIGIKEQTRTELRKKNKQKFIGWYGLYEGDPRSNFEEAPFNVEEEQSKGLKKDIPKPGRATGSRNRSAKKIGIFNASGDMMFRSFGNFNNLCKTHHLPKNAFATSYRNNGSPLYPNAESNISRLISSGNYQYKNWFAMVITD